MLPAQFIEAVAERDIDLLLIEEMSVSVPFRSWLLDQMFEQNVHCGQFSGAWHSLVHPVLGESDIVGLFEDAHGTKTALLIENKIDAVAQPKQAERYRLRGLAGIQDNLWHGFRTCIVAPQAYLDTVADAERYDVRLSYESIRDWFQNFDRNDDRSAYRSQMVQEAIEQNRRGYSPNPHSGVTQFWMDYWELANAEFSALHMRKPSKIPANSDWPTFRPTKLGKGRRILHKLAMGVVDLEIDGAGDAVERILAENRNLLGDELKVMRTGKSASIRLEVPNVDRFAEVFSQVEATRMGLAAASRLLRLSAELETP